MDRLKYIKLENEDGSYTSSIPLAVDSDYVNVNGESLTSELGKKASATSVNSSINNLQSQINGLASGSPAGVYATVTALTSADPDHSKIYLVSENGHWYYYSGSVWNDGGVYQAIKIADNSINIDNFVLGLEKSYEFKTSWGYFGGGVTRLSPIKRIFLEKNSVIKFNSNSNTLDWAYRSYTLSGTFIEDSGWRTANYVVPEDLIYELKIRKHNDGTIEENEIETLVSNLVIYKPVLNNGLKLIDYYANGNPIEIEEHYNNTSNIHIKNKILFWIMFENFVEFYNGDWATSKKHSSQRIKYDINVTYGSVTTTNNVDLIDVVIPSNYSLVLDTLNGTMKVKPYDELTRQDALLVRNAYGLASAGAYVEIYNDFKIREYNNNINNIETFIDYDKTVKAIAHRGYSNIAPENTLPAYKLARQKGFNYVECDVSFTSDNIPVLLHDSTIDRTSNGIGNINDLTFEQVRQYDFGSWKSSDYTGTQIPSFKEFIILCKNLQLHPYIEIKDTYNYTREQIQLLIDIVNECGMKGKVTWISFSHIFLGYVKDYDSKARLGYVRNDIDNGVIERASALKTENNEVFIDVSFGSVNSEKVALCLNANLPLETWTVYYESHIINGNPYISGYTSNDLIAGKILYSNNIN